MLNANDTTDHTVEKKFIFRQKYILQKLNIELHKESDYNINKIGFIQKAIHLPKAFFVCFKCVVRRIFYQVLHD